MAKCRVTQRSGRVGSAKHNDRSFLNGREDQAEEVAPHIDTERSGDNLVLSWQGRTDDLEKAELEFYRKHYSASCERRNKAYRHEGHADRCKTPDDLYYGRLTRPEEMILQIGDMNNHTDVETFYKCVGEYIQSFEEWNKAHGKHGHVLSVSIHTDEATPHAHIRRVWDYEKDGLTHLGQNKGLEQAGVPLPDASRKADRYNNRKMVFDSMMRERWQEICKSHGLEIETEPRPDVKHKQKADYIADQMDKQIQGKRQELSGLEKQVSEARELSSKADKLQERVDALESRERILSSAKVDKASKKAKTSLLNSEEVKIPKADFEALTRTAHAAEEAMRQADEAAKAKRHRQKLEADAQAKADKIISDARSKADSLKEHLAEIQLKQIQRAHPEMFNSFGVFDDGLQKSRPSKVLDRDGHIR